MYESPEEKAKRMGLDLQKQQSSKSVCPVCGDVQEFRHCCGREDCPNKQMQLNS